MKRLSGFTRRTTLALLISAAGLTLSAAAEVSDQVAAVVDDEIVTLSDLEWLVKYRGLEAPPDTQGRREFYEVLLDQVIDQKLIAMEAELTPVISITANEVDARVAAYKKRFASEKEFRQDLARMEISDYEFKEIIRRQVAVNEFIESRFKPFIIVLPNEIEEYYQEQFLPELKKMKQPIPALEVVEESIRQILTEQKTNQELERWLRTARRRARVVNLLFRENPLAPNLPPSLIKDGDPQPIPARPNAR